MKDFQQAHPESPKGQAANHQVVNDQAVNDQAVSDQPIPAEDSDRQQALEVTVRLFAAAAELMGTRQLRLRVVAGVPVTLRQVRQDLVGQYPRLTMLESVSRWAVDSDFIDDDWEITSDVTIAMIPPVSGG